MVRSETLCLSFKQSIGSCVLASYAIVSNHYTNIPIDAYFRDYCKHYNLKTDINCVFVSHWSGRNINDDNKYEFVYDLHFHKECQKTPGLKIIERLHHNSDEESFVSSRNKFDLDYIEAVQTNLDETETRLKQEDALLICAIPAGVHIATYGYDEKGFFTIETRPDLPYIVHKPSIRFFANEGEQIGDGLLTTSKR